MKEEIIDVDERGNLLAAESTNYGLIKPGQDDFYNVDDFNQNMDTIDHQLKVNENQIDFLFGKLGVQFAKWLDNPDYDTLIDFQRYRIGGGTNSPGGGVWYLEVNPVQSGIVYHRAKCVNGGNLGQIKERVLDANTGLWTEWESIATTTKSDIPFPFVEGYTTASYRDSKVYKDSLGMVTITCGFSKTSGNLDTGTDVLMGELPVGYRPMNGTQRINVPCACWGGDTAGIGYVYIDVDGKVRYSTLGNNATVMFIQCSFLATL